MAVVLGGYGQPEESPLVTGGLGLAGAAPPGALRATLRGEGSLAGTLTAGGSPTADMAATLAGAGALAGTLTDANAPDTGGWGPLPQYRPPRRREPIPAHAAALLAGTSSLTADLDYAIDPDALLADLASALLLDLV